LDALRVKEEVRVEIPGAFVRVTEAMGEGSRRHRIERPCRCARDGGEYAVPIPRLTTRNRRSAPHQHVVRADSANRRCPHMRGRRVRREIRSRKRVHKTTRRLICRQIKWPCRNVQPASLRRIDERQPVRSLHRCGIRASPRWNGELLRRTCRRETPTAQENNNHHEEMAPHNQIGARPRCGLCCVFVNIKVCASIDSRSVNS
jgi:hypothetical protein